MSDVSLLPSGPEYREVPDCPGYMAGSDGSLWSCWTKGRWPRRTAKWWRVKGTPTTQSGHLRVLLRTAAGFRVTDFLHRVILTTFVGQCPMGMIACHDPDHNPANNAVGNLRWATPTANSADTKRHGRHAQGASHPNAVLRDDDIPEVFRLRHAGKNHDEIAAVFGVRRAAITRVLLRHRYAHVDVGGLDKLPQPKVEKKYATGERQWKAKLTEDDVREMRRLSNSGWLQEELAAKFGVGRGTVSFIVNRKSWSHVE